MNIQLIEKLINDQQIEAEIETGITLMIKDDIFRPGTFRVHLPAPINASWLKEGQLLDSDPMFRMASVEDFPQRSVYFNEILTENRTFSVSYAFTSRHCFLQPDIRLIDTTEQKSFKAEQIEKFNSSHHCGCESYTALPKDAVRIQDVCEEKGLPYLKEYTDILSSGAISQYITPGKGQHIASSNESSCTVIPKNFYTSDSMVSSSNKGSLALSIYRYITENFNKLGRTDHNIAFVTMCRMCGIPARWQGGWDSECIKHDWAMVHLLPYGWMNVDCCFGAEAFDLSLNISGISLCDYFFGNLDPCIVPTASAPAADLYPAKDYERADKIFNVYGEVEMIPGKLTSDGHFDGFGLSQEDFSTHITIKASA